VSLNLPLKLSALVTGQPTPSHPSPNPPPKHTPHPPRPTPQPSRDGLLPTEAVLTSLNQAAAAAAAIRATHEARALSHHSHDHPHPHHEPSPDHDARNNAAAGRVGLRRRAGGDGDGGGSGNGGQGAAPQAIVGESKGRRFAYLVQTLRWAGLRGGFGALPCALISDAWCAWCDEALRFADRLLAVASLKQSGTAHVHTHAHTHTHTHSQSHTHTHTHKHTHTYTLTITTHHPNLFDPPQRRPSQAQRLRSDALAEGVSGRPLPPHR